MRFLVLSLVCGALSLGLRADEKELVSYKLENVKGRLVIKSSKGETIPWVCYGVAATQNVQVYDNMTRPMQAHGIKLFQLTISNGKKFFFGNIFSSADSKPVTEPLAPAEVDKKIAATLVKTPDARFVVRFNIQPGLAWRNENFREYVPLPKPLLRPDGFSVNPSLASGRATAHMVQVVKDTIAWCEKQPWRNRVVGYTIVPFVEGLTELSILGGYFEQSYVMKRRFKGYIKTKYKTDEALQKAWNDPYITLDKVTVPTDEEWMAKKKRLGIMHWPDPRKVQREIDYFTLQKELNHDFWKRIFKAMEAATGNRPVIKGYDILKQHMRGWLHNACFSGEWHPDTYDTVSNPFIVSGAVDTESLLDHPGLNILQTPGMYYNRALGYAAEAEGLTNSLNLRGKVNFMEADLRTWVSRNYLGKTVKPATVDAGTFMNEQEVKAGFLRQHAWALSRNQMYYYMSVCSANWWYHEDSIGKEVKTIVGLVNKYKDLPYPETSHAICLVIDDSAGFYEDFSGGFQYHAVYRQLEEGLAMCGVPYRIYLLSDLKKSNFPDYKCFLFPNLFKVDDEVMALLKTKVLRNGNVAIFGPGTGIFDGKTRSATAASKLFGVEMMLMNTSTARRVILQDHGHPISAKLQTTTYGPGYAYGPVLCPKSFRLDGEKGVTSLGACFYYYFNGKAGPFVKDFGKGGFNSGKPGKRGDGDYAVVFSPAVPIPAEFLRECCRYAGCNVWSETNNVVYANGNFVALHTVKSGKHTISLPEKVNVIDMLTGKTVGKGVDKIHVTADAPQTFMFLLEPASSQ